MTVIEACVDVRVPFHDVDPAGVVWHGHYFKYFELARCALLERLGYNYKEMADSGYVWPVVDLDARFLRPIIYDQSVRVRARLVEWEYRLKMEYRIEDVDGAELGRGQTIQVPVALDTREMVLGSPPILIERVTTALEGG